MLPLKRLFFIAALVLNVCGTVGGQNPPTVRPRPLKPRTGNLHPQRQATVIEGLLVARACPAGWTCDPGEWCYATGCCKLSEQGCDNLGCAPIGSNCCGDGSYCPISDYCDVAGCCPIGKVCSGGGGVITIPPTTKPTITTPKVTITTPKTTEHEIPTPSKILGSTTPHTTAPATAPTSVPTPSSGSKNVVIDVTTDSDISWDGDWVVVASSCTSGNKAKSCSGGSGTFSSGNMAYSFTGTSIYLSVASSNAQYMVTLDGEETNYGDPNSSNSTSTPNNCTFGWSRTNLSTGSHLLGIMTFGASISDNTRRDLESPWSVEIQNLVVTQPDSSTGNGGSSGGINSGSGSEATGVTSAASTNFTPMFLFTFLTIFVAILFY